MLLSWPPGNPVLRQWYATLRFKSQSRCSALGLLQGWWSGSVGFKPMIVQAMRVRFSEEAATLLVDLVL